MDCWGGSGSREIANCRLPIANLIAEQGANRPFHCNLHDYRCDPIGNRQSPIVNPLVYVNA